uniref:Uncharacterized protein n=1 Tax=Haptolina brevifila TaxID=156173 RepID=A0A7S2JP38_9EUKA
MASSNAGGGGFQRQTLDDGDYSKLDEFDPEAELSNLPQDQGNSGTTSTASSTSSSSNGLKMIGAKKGARGSRAEQPADEALDELSEEEEFDDAQATQSAPLLTKPPALWKWKQKGSRWSRVAVMTHAAGAFRSTLNTSPNSGGRHSPDSESMGRFVSLGNRNFRTSTVAGRRKPPTNYPPTLIPGSVPPIKEDSSGALNSLPTVASQSSSGVTEYSELMLRQQIKMKELDPGSPEPPPGSSAAVAAAAATARRTAEKLKADAAQLRDAAIELERAAATSWEESSEAASRPTTPPPSRGAVAPSTPPDSAPPTASANAAAPASSDGGDSSSPVAAGAPATPERFDDPINQQRQWLDSRLALGISSGMDSPMIYGINKSTAEINAETHYAATLVQAYARGHSARLRYGDKVQTLLVIHRACGQLQRTRSLNRMKRILSFNRTNRSLSHGSSFSRNSGGNKSPKSPRSPRNSLDEGELSPSKRNKPKSLATREVPQGLPPAPSLRPQLPPAIIDDNPGNSSLNPDERPDDTDELERSNSWRAKTLMRLKLLNSTTSMVLTDLSRAERAVLSDINRSRSGSGASGMSPARLSGSGSASPSRFSPRRPLVGGASPGASSTVSAKEWITLMELEGYRRLAREMHLRACPNCGSPVDIGFGIDGYTQCTECMARFRWLHAALFLPVSSVGGLLQEVRWEYDEARRAAPDNSVSWTQVGNLYWAATNRPARTQGATVKLVMYRGVIILPLVIALPVLTLKERRRQKKARQLELLEQQCSSFRRLQAPNRGVGPAGTSNGRANSGSANDGGVRQPVAHGLRQPVPPFMPPPIMKVQHIDAGMATEVLLPGEKRTRSRRKASKDGAGRYSSHGRGQHLSPAVTNGVAMESTITPSYRAGEGVDGVTTNLAGSFNLVSNSSHASQRLSASELPPPPPTTPPVSLDAGGAIPFSSAAARCVAASSSSETGCERSATAEEEHYEALQDRLKDVVAIPITHQTPANEVRQASAAAVAASTEGDLSAKSLGEITSQTSAGSLTQRFLQEEREEEEEQQRLDYEMSNTQHAAASQV